MNSLDQYIKLFEDNRRVIEQHAPVALNRPRQAALETLKRIGRLPRRGDEGFEVVSPEDMFAPDYGINIARVPFGADVRAEFSCDVPNVSSLSAMIVNDAFVAGPTLEAALPEGVEVMSLAKAAELYPGIFNDPVAPSDDPMAALNTLFVQDGVFIRVRRGTHLDKPIQILSIFNTSQPLMAARRVRIDIEEDAKATVLLCDHPRVGDVSYLSCRVVEATVGENATLDIYDLEESTPLTSRASVMATRQQAGSTLNACSLFLSGGTTRNAFYPVHAGEHCHTRLGGMVIAGDTQMVDNAVNLAHTYPRCESEQLFKYALFDEARGSFEGMVRVDPGAVFTEARQTNRNLLASNGARMHTMPQLEIYCDEVKASHGATTGQIDENALFYMRQRGIPEAEARMMLINAFMTDVLEIINSDPLRDRLRHLVDKRLRGCETTCGGCDIASVN